MFCRNYLDQYQRTKSIKQLSKNHRSSYKLMSQQNSALLKKQKSMAHKQSDSAHKSIKKSNIADKKSTNHLKTNLNSQNIGNNIKSVSSFMIPNQPIVYRKSLAPDEATSASIHKLSKNTRNVHFIALNRKKCSTNNSYTNKSIIEGTRMSNKKLSLDKNKYETAGETKPNTCYNSVVNNHAQPEQIALEHEQQKPENKQNLAFIYERMKKILQSSEIKEREWEREKQFYIAKIEQLEKQIKGYENIARCNAESKNLKIKKKNIKNSNIL